MTIKKIARYTVPVIATVGALSLGACSSTQIPSQQLYGRTRPLDETTIVAGQDNPRQPINVSQYRSGTTTANIEELLTSDPVVLRESLGHEFRDESATQFDNVSPATRVLFPGESRPHTGLGSNSVEGGITYALLTQPLTQPIELSGVDTAKIVQLNGNSPVYAVVAFYNNNEQNVNLNITPTNTTAWGFFNNDMRNSLNIQQSGQDHVTFRTRNPAAGIDALVAGIPSAILSGPVYGLAASGVVLLQYALDSDGTTPTATADIRRAGMMPTEEFASDTIDRLVGQATRENRPITAIAAQTVGENNEPWVTYVTLLNAPIDSEIGFQSVNGGYVLNVTNRGQRKIYVPIVIQGPTRTTSDSMPPTGGGLGSGGGNQGFGGYTGGN